MNKALKIIGGTLVGLGAAWGALTGDPLIAGVGVVLGLFIFFAGEKREDKAILRRGRERLAARKRP